MPDYEVELKFPLPDPDGLRSRLTEIGARSVGTVEQADTYFAHPVRRFDQTDEAFRLRTEGETNCLTYKGPLLDRTTKTRQEIELEIASGREAAHRAWAMLRALGFVDVLTVRKERSLHDLSWEGRPFSLAIDRVEGLGNFLEIETLSTAAEWETARDAAARLAERLGFSGSERRSYLQLLLDSPGRTRP